MQSNRWSPRRLLGLGLVLALAWLPTACGSKNDNNQAVFVDPGQETTGGITGGGVVGGSGGSTTTSGSSSTTTTTTSGTTGTTTGPSGSPSPGGTGTTGGAIQPSPAAVNTTDMLSPTDNNQRKQPTRMEPIQNLIAVNQGYSLGQANGQILLVDPTSVNGTPAPIILRRNANSPLNETLTNPWDLASDGTQNLLVTDGVGIAGQPGRVIRVTNISITASTPATAGNATASFVNAASNTSTAIFNPLFIEPIGGGIIFVSEYMPTPQGSIRRIDLATGNSTVVVTGLNFPAGMAADLQGQFLYICQNSNANGGAQGSVIRVPLGAINNVVNGTTANPIGPNDAVVNVITLPANAPPLNRPWECRVDSGGGLVIAEGQALGDTVQGAPGPAGLAQGAIRYVRPGSTVANMVLSGLSNCAGLQIQGTAGNENLIFFVQSLPLPTGAVNSLRFDRNNLNIPTGGFLSYGSALNLPIDTLPSAGGNGLPLKAAVNFFGGAANQGRVVDFR